MIDREASIQEEDSVEVWSSEDSLSIELRRPELNVDDGFARGIAYETIRRNLFGTSPVTSIGRYRLEQLIGRGGMGEVYSAHDPELDRRVAIKRVLRRADHDAEEYRRRRDALTRDARSAARIQHPHVVEIYDSGLEGEDLYVVMELVEGPTLDQWLNEHPRTWWEIVEIFVQIGQGLAAAHAEGIVHRDFKPSNVLVGADDRARVADFGLARMADELRVTRPGSDDAEASLVESLGLVGTPQYMAPEQYRGVEVGPRADQFAYCNALYRALFRALPFEGNTLDELATNVMEGRVRPPTDRYGAPRALVKLVLRGLATAPEDRHRSMEELVGQLRLVVVRRRRAAWAVGAAIVGLGMALGGYWWPRDPCAGVEAPWTPSQRSGVHRALEQRSTHAPHTVEPVVEQLDAYASTWSTARTDACEATLVRGEQSHEQMDLRLACLDRRRAPFTAVWSRLMESDGPTGAKALELVGQLAPASDCDPELVRASASRARAFGSQTDRSAFPGSEAEWNELSTRLANARADAAVGRFRRAYHEARELAELAQQREFRYLQAEALLLQGVHGLRLARTQSQHDAAKRALLRAAPYAVESGSPHLSALTLIELAATPTAGSLESREMWIELAAAHATRAPSDPLLSRIELVRGDLSLERMLVPQASFHYERAMDLGDGSPAFASAALGLARAQRNGSDLVGARQTLQRLRATVERSGSSAVLASALHGLALIALDEQDASEARALSREVDEIHRASRTIEVRERLSARVTWAKALRQTGQPVEARPILRGVLAAIDGGEVVDLSLSTYALDEMVEVWLALELYREAIADAERWVMAVTTLFPREHPEVARAHMMLAHAMISAGEPERALPHAAMAYESLKHGALPAIHAESTYRYAQAALGAGDRETALRLLHEVEGVLAGIPHSDAWLADVQQWAKNEGLEHER